MVFKKPGGSIPFFYISPPFIPTLSKIYLSFRQYEGRTRTLCEVWLKNGLPIRESLYELYIRFMKERGIDGKLALEDLTIREVSTQ